MFNEFSTKTSGEFGQVGVFGAADYSGSEIVVSKDQAQLDSLSELLFDALNDDCQCSENFDCDRCDFIECVRERNGALNQFMISQLMHYSRELDMSHFEVQSGTQQVTVNFGDNNTGEVSGFKAPISYTKPDKSWATDMDAFMKRPVLIDTITWTVGNTVTDSINPWHLYFSSAPIKKKLDNYFLIRCNLKVKVVINASPFYYGCVLMSYRPLTDTASSLFNPSPIYSGVGAGSIPLIGRSQRPHAFIYPQTNEGCELQLPFMYHKNWIDATVAQDLRDMGCINFDSFGVLYNANSVAGTSVELKVYAWAEDVELAGATDDLAVQSGDEYVAEGAVSSIASAIERTTTGLSEVPIIGPFMTATSYAAGAIKNIAKIFGYTNVPVIDDVHAMINKPFPNLATTDIGIPIEKLTLDAKNELTVDPQICGCACDDQLVISHICARESFIFSAVWTATDPTNDLVFNSLVEPTLSTVVSGLGQQRVQGVPSWMVAQMFKYWRGDLIFRFKIVKSQYHRGRLKFTWDPTANIQTISETSTTSFTHVVDIAETDDIEFRIPYLQATSYLQCSKNLTSVKFADTAVTSSPNTSNGIITARVLIPQSSPVASADVLILVFVRCADNIEFADPTEISEDLHAYAVQSGDEKNVTVSESIAISGSSADENINLMYMGETVKSLRQIMRRSTYHRTLPGLIVTFSSPIQHIQNSVFRRLPLYPGFDPNGIHVAIGPIGGGSAPYNFVNWVPLTWITQCFVGVRGSVIWNAVTNGPNGQTNKITRSNVTQLTVGGYATVNTAVYSGSSSTNARFNIVNNPASLSGTALTMERTNSSMNVLAPMYSNYKFLATSFANRTLGSATVDGSDTDALRHTFIKANTDMKLAFIDYYSSIGTDFNAIMFLNVPTLFYSAIVPTAV